MNSQLKKIPDGIFICYRRYDSERWAERIVSALQDLIGKHNIFFDSNFEPGKDWNKQIDQALNKSSIVIILIGPDFLKIKDKNGKPRIENQKDIVRYEIRSALTLNKNIIPVLIDGSKPPLPHLFPADISPIANFEYKSIRDKNDLQPLFNIIKEKLHGKPNGQFRNFSHINYHPLNRNKAKRYRTSIVKDLVNAGWDIDTSKKGTLAYNVRFPKFRFRFDEKEDYIWLEKKRNRFIRKNSWKFERRFSILPGVSSLKRKKEKISYFLSAIINPEAYLTSEERLQHNDVLKSEKKKSKDSQYYSDLMNGLKSSKNSNGIYICYQEDDRFLANLLVLSLKNRIGEQNVFNDNNFAEERDWRDKVDKSLKKWAIIVILIGPNFSKLKGKICELQIENKIKIFHYKIRSALTLNKKIIPVLVDGAKPPLPHLLPAELIPITNLQFFILKSRKDSEKLCDLIEVEMHKNNSNDILKKPSENFVYNNQVLIYKAKNIAIQKLIDSGWDIDTQNIGAPFFNERFNEYRFIFNDKKGTICLEKLKRRSIIKPQWKIVKIFFLVSDIISYKNNIVQYEDFCFAVNNPLKYHCSKSNDENSDILDKEKKIEFQRSKYDLQLNNIKHFNLYNQNPNISKKLNNIEKISRSSEKLRRNLEMKNVISHFDIDCKNEIVKGTNFSPRNDTLAVSHNNSIKLWNILNKKWEKNIFSSPYYIGPFCWSNSGLIVIGLENGSVIVWNPITNNKYEAPKIDSFFKRNLTTSQLLSHTINSLDWSMDERFIVYSSDQFPIIIWDMKTNFLTHVENTCLDGIHSEKFSFIERLTNKYEKKIFQWAGMGFNGSNIISFQTKSRIFSVGTEMANDSNIVLIDSAENKTVCKIPYKGIIKDLKFSPSNKHLVIASNNATIHIVNIKNILERNDLIGHEIIEDLTTGDTAVLGIAFRPNSNIFASIAYDRNLIIWDVNEKIMKSCIPISLHDSRGFGRSSISWSQNGSLLSCPWEESRVRIFNIGIV